MSLISRLRDLVAALDRRTPQPGRTNEDRIAADSAALRSQALAQIALIEGQGERS